MGGDTLRPEVVRCPSVGECQGGRMRVGGCRSTLIEAGGGGEWVWEVEKGSTRKGKTFEMEVQKISRGKNFKCN